MSMFSDIVASNEERARRRNATRRDVANIQAEAQIKSAQIGASSREKIGMAGIETEYEKIRSLGRQARERLEFDISGGNKKDNAFWDAVLSADTTGANDEEGLTPQAEDYYKKYQFNSSS